MADKFNISDVMISYSRRDSAFVKRLEQSLITTGREVWVDWQDIPPTADWWAEIQAGIEAAHTFIFVISPDSATSDICYREVEHAVNNNKRLVPILFREVTDPEQKPKIHPALGQYNWVFFRENDDFNQGFQTLVRALDTDLDHTQLHTRLLIRAKEWDERARGNGYLLRGDDLREAENWFSTAVAKTPAPSALQAEYITASRRAAQRFRRVVAGAMVGTILALAILAAVAVAAAGDALNQAAIANARATQVAERETAQVTFIVQIGEQKGTADFSSTQAAESVIIAQTAATAAVESQLTANAAATAAHDIQQTADAASTNVGNIGATAQTAAATAATQAAQLRETSSFAETEAAGASTKAASAGTQAAEAGTQAFNSQQTANANATSAGNVAIQATHAAQTQAAANITSTAARLTEIAANATATQSFFVQLTAAMARNTATAAIKTQRAANKTAIVVNNTVTAVAQTAVVVQTELAAEQTKVAQEQELARRLRLSVDAVTALENGDQPGALQRALLSIAPNGIYAPLNISRVQDFYNLAYSTRPHKMLTKNAVSVVNVMYSQDGSRLISGSSDGTVRLWDVNPRSSTYGQQIGNLSLWNGIVDKWNSPIAFNPSLSLSVSILENSLLLWDVNLASPTYGQQLLPPLQGHTNQVLNMAFSPDGKRIVSCAKDYTVRLWDSDLTSSTYGQQIGVPIQASSIEYTCSIAFSPDGKLIAYGSIGTWIRLLDVDPKSPTYGQQLGTTTLQIPDFEPITYLTYARSVAFSPDGKRVAAGFGYGLPPTTTLLLWDVDPTSPTYNQQIGDPLIGHTDTVYTVSFSSDGKRLISGASDRTLRLWDIDPTSPSYSRQIGTPRLGHTLTVQTVAFSPDGKSVASGSYDGTVQLWDVAPDSSYSQQIGTPFADQLDRVTGVDVSLDGKRIVVGLRDNTLQLWNVDFTSPTHRQRIGNPLVGHTDDVNSVAFSPDGKRVISGSADDSLRLWDVDPASSTYGQLLIAPLVGHTDDVNSVAFSPDGKRVISGSADDSLRLWDVDSASLTYGQLLIAPFVGHTDDVNSVAFGPDGNRVVSGSADDSLRLWDVDIVSRSYGQQIWKSSDSPSDQYTSLSISSDGKHVVTGSRDGSLRLWEIPTTAGLGIVIGPNVTRTPPAPERSQKIIDGHISSILDVAFNPDGKHVVSASADSTLRVWDVDQNSPTYGQQINISLSSHTQAVNSIAFSPDGNFIVSGSNDATFRLWRAFGFDQLVQWLCTTRVVGKLTEEELDSYGLTQSYECPENPVTLAGVYDERTSPPAGAPQPPLVLDNGVGALRGIGEPPTMPTPTLMSAIPGDRLLPLPAAPMTATATPEWMPTVSP